MEQVERGESYRSIKILDFIISQIIFHINIIKISITKLEIIICKLILISSIKKIKLI